MGLYACGRQGRPYVFLTGCCVVCLCLCPPPLHSPPPPQPHNPNSSHVHHSLHNPPPPTHTQYQPRRPLQPALHRHDRARAVRRLHAGHGRRLLRRLLDPRRGLAPHREHVRRAPHGLQRLDHPRHLPAGQSVKESVRQFVCDFRGGQPVVNLSICLSVCLSVGSQFVCFFEVGCGVWGVGRGVCCCW